MDDLGTPTSYLLPRAGAAVYSSDGERIGEVAEIRAEPTSDIFDGLVIGHGLLGGNHRFVGADQVEELFERGVVLKLDAAAAERLPPAH
jgi:uncharacterized protein YrrD